MNPLAIRIAANLAEFKANMKEMKLQLETNASAMKRMSSAFDGSKAIGDANAMVKAIHDIGGASKLTEAEQKRVNAAVTEAIAKYKVLGREAPPELLALRDATNKTIQPMKDLGSTSTSLMGTLKGVAGTLGIAFGGAAVVSGIKSLVAETFTYAETIKDTSAKLAISMEATQRWKFAAEQTGASLENVSKSVLKLSQGVAGGDKGLKEALESAGVQFASLKGMKPEDAFNLVADAIAKIPDPMTQADVALAAFGKSGAELLPALRDGFVDLGKQASVMSDKTIEALDKAKDKWEEFSAKITVATGGIVAKILGMMEKIAPAMQLLMGLTGNAGAADMWGVFVAGADKASNSVKRLTESEKQYADELIKKFGKPAVAAMGPLFEAYVKSLDKAPPALDRNTKAVKQLGVSWSGTFDDIFNYSKAWQAEQDAMAAAMKKVSWSGTAKDIEDYSRALGDAALAARNMVSWSGSEGDMTAYNKMLYDAGLAGTKVGGGFMASFTKALEGLGGVIVGAIQGGGDVGRAAMASIGASMGADLGAKIAAGIGGSLGKALGGLAGPLGSLLGSAVGGLLDKVFGKNQGREDAKAFASMFGGFDALREKMLVLGDEGERLWIALTQNTKGPAQVAQAIKAIEDALARAEEQAKKTGKELEDTFKGPEGARGFQTRAQLQKAAAEAKATYDYIASSGEYTADVIEQAWQQWQDAMIASGDVTAKRMKELSAEIVSLQKAVEAETPEYDAAGVRQYGVEELRNIERLAALEAEKARLELARIAEKDDAVVVAAAAADLQAKKEFEAAKLRAIDLDGYLRKLFSGGYEIPITFRLPGGAPSGPVGGGASSLFGGGLPSAAPSRPVGGMATVTIVNVNQMDGEVVARKTVRHTARLLPAELAYTGALRQ